MSVEGIYHYYIIALSVVIAILASYLALNVTSKLAIARGKTTFYWLLAGSFVTGSGIVAMQYMGIKAALFMEDPHVRRLVDGSSPVNPYLFYGVTLTICMIVIVSWGAMFIDRQHLKKMAYTDTITGLPNRNEMNRFFDKHIGKETIAVLFLDLDQFKVINDTLGHDIGDLLVQTVGSRLRSFRTEKQQVFRISGDEFLIISLDCLQDAAEQKANQILQKIKEPYILEGNELSITGSIGISMGSVQGSDRSMLLKTADKAMYRAKSLGKNQYFVYTEEMG